MPAVARFVKDWVLYSGRYDLRLISLAMSAQDESSVRLIDRQPMGARCRHSARDSGKDLPFVHVGAVIGELEFQRYRPRRALTEAVS